MRSLGPLWTAFLGVRSGSPREDRGARPQPSVGGAASGPEVVEELVCWLLAFAGGWADAGSFVLVGNFTGHVTGNGVLAMVQLVSGRWPAAAWCLLAVACFLGGTAAAIAWKRTVPCARTLLSRALACEIVLIAVAVTALKLWPDGGRIAFVMCVCLALGVQNGVLDRLGKVSIHSTYVTGMSTSLVAATLSGKAAERRTLAGVIGSFALGAAGGAAFAVEGGTTGYAVVLTPILIAFWLLVRTDVVRIAE